MTETAYKTFVRHVKVGLENVEKDLDELRARVKAGNISTTDYITHTTAVYTRQSILLAKLQKLIHEGPKGTRWDKLLEDEGQTGED